MKFILPENKYSDKEKKLINENYNLYLSELIDYRKMQMYIDLNTQTEKKSFKEKEIYLMIFLYSIINLIFSILSITLFKEETLIDLFVYTIALGLGLFFIPILIHSFLENIKSCILRNLSDKISNLEKMYREKYKEDIVKKYALVIESYNNIQKEEKEIEKKKNNYFQYMSRKVRQASIEELTNMIVWYLKQNSCRVYNSKEKSLFAIAGNKKTLVIIKKLQRSISITDVEITKKQMINQNFEQCYLFYIGNISDKAYKYCMKNNIKLFGEKNIVTKLYELKLKEDNEETNSKTQGLEF